MSSSPLNGSDSSTSSYDPPLGGYGCEECKKSDLPANLEYAIPLTIYFGREWRNLKTLDFKGWLLRVPFYLIGMITFTVALPVRIIRVLGRALLLIIVFVMHLFSRDEASLFVLKNRCILLGVSSLKLAILPLAILCPPIGYYLEMKINDHLLPEDEKVYYIIKMRPYDYYEESLRVLKLSGEPSLQELTAAYKKLCLEGHPDKGGDSKEFHKLNSAFEALKSDPRTKDLGTKNLEKVPLSEIYQVD